MNFLKALWRSIVPAPTVNLDTPSQYVKCPHCGAMHADLTTFEQEHAEFVEGDNVTQLLYTCGRCYVQSLWFVDTGELISITSYGITLKKLREDIYEHFRYWLPGKFNMHAALQHSFTAIKNNVEILERRHEWEDDKNAKTFLTGCAADFIVYGLLLSSKTDFDTGIKRCGLHSTCVEIDDYMTLIDNQRRDFKYYRLVERAENIARRLAFANHKAQAVDYTTCKKLDYVFVEPAIHECASLMFRLGLDMLRKEGTRHFHSIVYERLRHFVFMSV